MFKALIGSKASVVPYKTSPELVTALQRGDIDVSFDYLAAFAPGDRRKSDQDHRLSRPKRSPLTPDTPTVVESGWPSYVVTSWNGIAAPAGTPRAIIDKLNGEITAVLKLPELQDRFPASLGMEATGSTPEEMTERLKTDVDRWRDIIGKLGLRP